MNEEAEQPESLEGGCRCGAVRYRTHGTPFKSAYCHCQDCRSATSALVQAWLMFDGERIEFTRESPKKYASSPGVKRGFCAHCGTPLWWEGRWHDTPMQMVPIGTLDDPTVYPPDRHASINERVPWFDVDDDNPRFGHSSPAEL